MPELPPLIIAIDGPAGSGKSTVTRRVAARLGILYLDTGAMYRAATVGLLAAGIAIDDAEAVAAWVGARAIGFDAAGQVALDGQSVPETALRSPETTREIWRVADNAACRQHLVALQQEIVRGRDAALEGRDTGTVICPEAPLKIYLDASPEARAGRRLAEWGAAAPPLAQVVAEIVARDQRDGARAVGALARAPDALLIETDDLSPDEVEARILALVVQRRPLVLEQVVADQLLVGRSRDAGYVKVAQGSVSNPPAPWQLGLTNPSADRLPDGCRSLACNQGGRQAGVLCQGRAVIVLAGSGEQPGALVALPMLPQTWYVIEPGVWHAVIQTPGTIAAWAEASEIHERHAVLDATARAVLAQYLGIYLPG